MKRVQHARWRVSLVLFSMCLTIALAVACSETDPPFCLNDNCKSGTNPDGGSDLCEGKCTGGLVCAPNGKCEPPDSGCGHCNPATTHCVDNKCVPGGSDPCGGACDTGTVCNTGTGKCEANGGGDPCNGHCDPPGSVCDPNTKQCVPGPGGDGGAGGDGGGLPCGGHCGNGTHCVNDKCEPNGDGGTGGDSGAGGDSGTGGSDGGTCNPVTDPCSCACNGTTTFCNPSTKSCMTGLCDGVNDVAEGWKTGTGCTNGGVGDCFAVGVIICDGPYVTRCNAPTKSPSKEICDGHDNNCNGSVDEGLFGCTCIPTTEVCGNLKDDDCDGIVDDC